MVRYRKFKGEAKFGTVYLQFSAEEECDATGEITCDTCNGSGIDPDNEEESCWDCNGDGVRTCPSCNGNTVMDCPECYGSRIEPCPECDEVGEIETDDLDYEMEIIATWDKNLIQESIEFENTLVPIMTLEEYRKKAANLVDENNANMLTDESSLSSGKSIYMANCIACHGKDGEGTIGPNLVDDYWLHKGGIKDIFKTIKYGYPEKGMKSWQQDLPAKSINDVASYIKSLRGTNPPNAKEKQGDLYTEENLNDSTKTIVKDSTEVVVIQK